MEEKHDDGAFSGINPILVFEGEVIPTPPGLAELLEKTWVYRDSIQIDPNVKKYDRRTEKVNGHWRTIYTLKRT